MLHIWRSRLRRKTVQLFKLFGCLEAFVQFILFLQDNTLPILKKIIKISNNIFNSLLVFWYYVLNNIEKLPFNFVIKSNVEKPKIFQQPGIVLFKLCVTQIEKTIRITALLILLYVEIDNYNKSFRFPQCYFNNNLDILDWNKIKPCLISYFLSSYQKTNIIENNEKLNNLHK